MKTKEKILIENADGVLTVITEKEFHKLTAKDTKYKLLGTIRPKYSKRYLTTEQKNSVVDSIRTNPTRFHMVPVEKVIEGIKECVFKNLNT